MLSDLHDCCDLELQSIATWGRCRCVEAGWRLPPQPRGAIQQSHPPHPPPADAAGSWGKALPHATASQTVKVCLATEDSKELTYISSWKNEYALKRSLALKQAPGYAASGHIPPQYKSPIPEQDRRGTTKDSCHDGTKCFSKKLSHVQRICPIL